MPCPGNVELYYAPGGPGVRIDSHVYGGYTIPPYYDSMIGKLIVTADTRQDAIQRMHRALNEYIIRGVKTTIPVCKKSCWIPRSERVALRRSTWILSSIEP